ncbi:MAG: glutamyl-tRNA reductase [Myxococcaceae bacterium]
MMPLRCVGLSHHQAPVAVRERLALTDAEREAWTRRFRAQGVEVLVLSTCNRVEVFLAGDASERASDEVKAALAAQGGEAVSSMCVERVGESALVHLFRVAASLDSMVVGEAQILGQLKDAFEESRNWGAVGSVLTRMSEASFGCAKRVRSETGVGRAATSLASAAIVLAEKVLGGVAGRQALVLGAGEFGELVARHLMSQGVGALTIATRSPERATALASALNARTASLEALDALLLDVDLVVCSTAAPRPLISVERVSRVLGPRTGRPLVFIDLAVPRDVDPAVHALSDVFVYDLDDIQSAQQENVAARAAEALKAERIVAEEVARFGQAWAVRTGVPVLAQLRAHAEAIARTEAQRTLSQFDQDWSERQRRSVEAMAQAIVNKLLHAPTSKLRDSHLPSGDGRLAEVAAKLFGLVEDEDTETGAEGESASSSEGTKH